MNKRNLYLFIFLSVLVSNCSYKRLYVKYGQTQQRFVDSSANDGVIRIAMDRFGTIYPGTEISDQLIKNSYSILNQVYQFNPTVFEKALQNNQLPLGSTTDQLQEKLIEQFSARINQAAQRKKIVFIIHGFNKHPFKPVNASAYKENRDMRKKIVDWYGSDSFQFVELYWDGLTWANTLKPLGAFVSIKIWDNAQAASANVGLEFRRILNKINAPGSYIITHSLGASVATTALFNVDKYNNSSFRQDYLNKYADTFKYRSPTSNFKIALLAPAIPGQNTFDEFYERTPSSPSPSENLSVLVGFNRNDRVLRKFKLAKPTHIGSTSLGCIMSEVDSARALVNIGGRNLFDTVSFSYGKDQKKQKAHAFQEYVLNETAMNEFLKKLFGE